MYLRRWQGCERHVAHREQRVSTQEQGERGQASIESAGRIRPLEAGVGGRGRGEGAVDQQNFDDHGDHDVTIEHHHR